MRIGKKFLVGIASMLVATGAFVAILNATGLDTNAFTITSRKDCGYTDPIVDCGTVSTEQMLDVYDKNNDRRGNRDIQAIFHHYGITRTDLTGQTSEIKHGWLGTNGDISVGGKIVARNAQSLNRADPGYPTTPVSIAGKTFLMGTVNGHYTKGADVFVFLRDGVFHAAIQASCGNPIVATPTEPKPAYTCNSLTPAKLARDRFRFSSSASVTNAKIVSYNYDFGDGVKSNNQPQTVEHTYAKPGTYTVTMTVNVEVNGKVRVVPGANCKTTVKVEEVPKVPAYKCESLTVAKIDRATYRFTAKASASSGAEVVNYNYDFGDGQKPVNQPNVVTHTYKTQHAYTYTVTVTANIKVGGKIVKAGGADCKVTVKVPEADKPGISIIKTVNNKEHDKIAVNTEFTYEITVNNTGNVTLKNAVVTDKAPKEVTLISAGLGTIKNNVWTYTIPELKVNETKKFIIKAKYTKYASGTHKNTVCVDTPTIPGKPDDCDEATTETSEPIKVCDLTDNTVKIIDRSQFDESHMTTDLSKCGEIEVCIIEDRVIKVIAKKDYDETTMTTDMSKCKEVPVVPVVPELPKTGIDTLLSGSLGLGSITAAGYYWTASRRNLFDALLRK